MPHKQLSIMIATLEANDLAGVSAQTLIEGSNYATKGLNAWRRGRFRPGPATVIGTPTLLRGDLLRQHPYDPNRRFSDDSELCERWTSQFSAKFAISGAYVLESGKTSWDEIRIRCEMYGVSDSEVFREGRYRGWSIQRRLASLAHPLRVDFLTPIRHLELKTSLETLPFMAAFTGMRYFYWIKQSRDYRITEKAR
jgi:hypothetical protein